MTGSGGGVPATLNDQLIVAAYRGGASLRSLADALGWTRRQVEQRLVRCGEPKRELPRRSLPAERSWWERRLASGVALAAVADQFGVSRTTVYRHARALGLTTGTRPQRADSFEEWLMARVDRHGRCQVWTATVTAAGHPIGNFQGRKFVVRREVWVRANGPLASSDEVYRTPTCPHRLCVALGHLRIGTVTDRMTLLAAAGTYAHGEEHWNAKLTEHEARDILASRASVAELAARYRVSRSTVNAIRKGTRWRHLTATAVTTKL